MLEMLKALANASDSVVVLGLPNVRYILKADIYGETALVYRGSTGECRALVPVEIRGYVEQLMPRQCLAIPYSYDIAHQHEHIISKTFGDALVGFLKAFARPGTEIGIPFRYMDFETYLKLSRYWKLKDISKELVMLRARKSYEDLSMLVGVHRAVKEVLEVVPKADAKAIAVESFKTLSNLVDGICVEPVYVSKEVVSLSLRIKKGVYRIGYRWSIPLDKSLSEIYSNVGRSLDRAAGGVRVGVRCLDLVRSVKSQLQQSGARALGLEVCGVGTEICEYPSISECLYEDAVLDNGMVVKIEVRLDEKVYLPKLFAFVDGRVEVY